MGWSEMRRIPNLYSDEVAKIDEQILGLVKARKEITGINRYFPPTEQLKEWALKYGMEIPLIGGLIQALNLGSQPVQPNEIGSLLSVLPIMKKTVLNGCDYTLTHSMQHENVSLVFVEIQLENSVTEPVQIHPQLLLEVIAAEQYSVQKQGASGTNNRVQLRFSVSPPLAEDLSDIQFSLIPYAAPYENKTKQLILDQQVDF